MFEKLASKDDYHLPNFHKQKFESMTQSSMSNYTTKSDGYKKRQHFTYGQAAGGTSSNSMIYGGTGPIALDMSGIKMKPPVRKYFETPGDAFLYGKNDVNSFSADKKISNIFSLEERTSAEIRKKQKEAKETEQQYKDFLQQKEFDAKRKDQEKRKDLLMLKSYKQPWGKPGAGAPKGDDNNFTKEVHRLVDHKEQILPLGRPGAGAPLRTISGSLKANLAAHPEIRFQKRDRDQIHDIIKPENSKFNHNDPLVTNLDLMAHDTRERRNVMRRDQDLSTTTYDPFGRPGAGAPMRDQNGQTRAFRSTNLARTVQGEGNNCNKLQDDSLPYGTPRFKKVFEKDHDNAAGFQAGFGKSGGGAPIYDGQGNVVTAKRQTLMKSDDSAIIKSQYHHDENSYDPFGKVGAGAPIRDKDGNLKTQISGRYMNDQLGITPRQQEDIKSKKMYLQSLRQQIDEHHIERQQQENSRKEGSTDTLSWLQRGAVGKRPYDNVTHEIIGAPRVTSDIVKQRLVQQNQDKQKSRLYHAQLDQHARDLEESRSNQKQQEREKSVEHARTMNNIWGKNGHGAPSENPRRQKVDVVATKSVIT